MCVQVDLLLLEIPKLAANFLAGTTASQHAQEASGCLHCLALSVSKQRDFSTGLNTPHAWDPSLDPSSAAKGPSSSIPSATKAWVHVSYLSGYPL